MSEPLTEQDMINLAHAAEYIHRTTEDADRANQERESLKHADDATRRETILDKDSHTFTRMSSLLEIIDRDRVRGGGTQSGIMPKLWDDTDEQPSLDAIRASRPPPTPGRLTARRRGP